MPLTYRVDSSLKVVFETWSGIVTPGDLRASWARLMADPDVQACRRNLADLTQAKFALSGADLENSVREVILPVVRDGDPWYSAIVVTEPASYGTSRQFQVFAEAGIRTALFQDAGAALTWLLMQEPGE